MTAFLVYLAKSSAALALVYVAYYFLLKGRTTFRFNRAFLLGGVLVSLLVPFVSIAVSPTTVPLLSPWIFDGVGPLDQAATPLNGSRVVDLIMIVSFAYWVGVVAALVPVVHSLYWIYKINQSSTVAIVHGHRARISNTPAFTFFHWMFLPSTEVPAAVVDHERAHIEQKHWLDLLMVELVLVLQWFNPFSYLYRRAVILQHEYLADEAALQKHSEENYLLALLSQLTPVVPEFTHAFQSKNIQHRIMMMSRTKNTSKAIYWIALPMVTILVMAFARYDATVPVTDGRTYQSAPTMAPVDLSKVKPGGSGFGMRMHPVLQKEVFHTGVDFILPVGEKVMATLDGVVTGAGYDDMRGNYVLIRHNERYSTSYFHLDQVSTIVNAQVTRGQVIGLVGNSGNSVGPHLHYEVLEDGKAIDPGIGR